MIYDRQDVIQYIEEEDVKFIRLVFCDVFGRPKNISIMPGELDRAFEYGIAVDASAIRGFGGDVTSDLFLHPDPSTIAVLPWRPEHGRVVRMFCDISYPDGKPFENDTRRILKDAVACAKEKGYAFSFGAEIEFYLFKLGDEGDPTAVPYDRASYMDMAPDDRGENVRREICLALEQMGIHPESSHHEEGPGQNEIDFCYSDPLSCADNAITFKTVVKAIAQKNGLWADFSAKPLADCPGSGMHINISVRGPEGEDPTPHMIAGILKNVQASTLFLNPTKGSYERLGSHKAPRYVSWSAQNRSQLVRIPAAYGKYRRAELRSADPSANPYLAFALLIRAGLEGIGEKLPLCDAVDLNLYTAGKDVTDALGTLPLSLRDAAALAAESDFIKRNLPETLIENYFGLV
ncbi:MAG: glutamine synthetase [Lachnospiraceae bacterium]|nr:glutamine synthetase [Lachnospiraceae bacterium]